MRSLQRMGARGRGDDAISGELIGSCGSCSRRVWRSHRRVAALGGVHLLVHPTPPNLISPRLAP